MTTAPARRDDATTEWYDALAADRLMLKRCPAGHDSRPDVLACDVCGDDDLGWSPAGGQAAVVGLAVDHAVGTTVVIAELAEGPWLLTRLEGRAVALGDAVIVTVVHPDDGEAYPVVAAARTPDGRAAHDEDSYTDRTYGQRSEK